MKFISGLLKSAPLGAMLALLMLALILSPVLQTANAQFSSSANATQIRLDNSGRVFTFQCTVDSTANDTSKTFSLDGFEVDSTARYGVSYGLIHSSTDGVSVISLYVQGSFGDGNWVAVKTLLSTDSTETYQTGQTYLNTNNPAGTLGIFPYYRVIFDGLAGNRSDCIAKLRLHPWKRNK